MLLLGDLPRDTTVVVEDFDVFRYYLDRFSHDEVRWRSDQVAAAIDELGLSDLYNGRHQLARALGEIRRHSTHHTITDGPF
ncbi:hypothetical protein [Nocardia lijiangensis]|uniref:hypothetical protein n=1 Tax=Nocardia lijiangensis TaxID=299618 RepID=UPI000834EFD2|nr:hypothetical protein [Nocardia lijiangensis]